MNNTDMLYSFDHSKDQQSEKLNQTLLGGSFMLNQDFNFKPKHQMSFLPFLKLKYYERLIGINSRKVDSEKKKRLFEINSKIEQMKKNYERKFPTLNNIENETKPDQFLPRMPFQSLTNETNTSLVSLGSFQKTQSFQERLLTNQQRKQSHINLRVKTFIKNLNDEREKEKKLEFDKLEIEKYKKISTIKSFIKNYYSTSSLFNFTVKEKWKYAFHRILENIYKRKASRAKTKTEKNRWKRRSTLNQAAIQKLVTIRDQLSSNEKIKTKPVISQLKYIPRHLAQRVERKANKTVSYTYVNTVLIRKTLYEKISESKIEEETESVTD